VLSQVFGVYLVFFRLKKQYRAANERIGRTGAGLKAEDIVPGSEIANIIGTSNSCILRCFLCKPNPIVEKETQNFKWWPRLHGYWRRLPNFNPYTVTSDPGQDLADEALSVLMGGHGHGDLGLVRMQLFSGM
jgi:hypothetical protein